MTDVPFPEDAFAALGIRITEGVAGTNAFRTMHRNILRQVAANLNFTGVFDRLLDTRRQAAGDVASGLRVEALRDEIDRIAQELGERLQARPDLTSQWARDLSDVLSSGAHGVAAQRTQEEEADDPAQRLVEVDVNDRATAVETVEVVVVDSHEAELQEVIARFAPHDIQALAEAIRQPLGQARAAAARGGMNGWAERNQGWLAIIMAILALLGLARDQVEWMSDDDPAPVQVNVTVETPSSVDPAVLDKLIEDRIDDVLRQEVQERDSRGSDDHDRHVSGSDPGTK